MDLEYRDLLLAIAQIAVTIAGFSSLAGIFAGRRGGVLIRSIANPLRGMLDYSITVFLAALFPFLPDLAGASARTTWVISSGAFAVGNILYYVFSRAFLRDVLSGPESTRLVKAMLAIDGVIVFALAVNASGLFFEPSLAIYFAALYWFLAGAAIGFVNVVSQTWRDR